MVGRQTFWDENGQITSEGEYESTFNRVWWCSEYCLSKWRENGSFEDDIGRYNKCYSCKQASLQNLVQAINGETTNLDGQYVVQPISESKASIAESEAVEEECEHLKKLFPKANLPIWADKICNKE